MKTYQIVYSDIIDRPVMHLPITMKRVFKSWKMVKETVDYMVNQESRDVAVITYKDGEWCATDSYRARV